MRVWIDRSTMITASFGSPILRVDDFNRWTRFKLRTIGVRIDPWKYERLRRESELVLAHATEIERALWTTHATLTHPGFK